MKIIGKRVLIEQTSVKKESKIILTDKSKEQGLEITFKVIQLGNECPTGEGHVKVGDIPVFTEHVTFDGHKMVTLDKAPNGEVLKAVAHTVVYYDDIVATEND
jgi:hypothetical protein